MKRRDFLKTGSAAVALPVLPLQAFGSAHYAELSGAAAKWAYATVGSVKQFLGVDDKTARMMFARLQSDGVIGVAGPTGLAQPAKMRVAQVAAVSRSGKLGASLTREGSSSSASELASDLLDAFDEASDDEDLSNDETRSSTF